MAESAPQGPWADVCFVFRSHSRDATISRPVISADKKEELDLDEKGQFTVGERVMISTQIKARDHSQNKLYRLIL